MKKRITSILVAFSMLLSIIPFFSIPSFASNGNLEKGSGLTVSDPILIEDALDLMAFRDRMNADSTHGAGKYYAITNNIDLSSSGNWTPIDKFCGSLDGRNHTIRGITIYETVAKQTAFIREATGTTGFYAQIKNLHLKGNYENTARTDDKPSVSGLLDYSDGCLYVGNCSFDGTLTGHQNVCGLIDCVFTNVGPAVIENCWTTGTMNNSYVSTGNTAQHSYIGPLFNVAGNTAGTSDKVTIQRCYSNMNCNSTDSAALSSNTLGLQFNIPVTFLNYYSTGTGFNSRYWYSAAGKAYFVNCHVYSDVTTGRINGNGTATATNSFVLTSAATSSVPYTGITAIPAGAYYYSNPTTFNATPTPGWDFDSIWKMDTTLGYPVLQSFFIDSDVDRTLTYYGESGDNTFDLTEFYHCVLDDNRNYNAHNRFKYNITSGNVTQPKKVWDSTSYAWVDSPTDNITFANISIDTLTLNPDMPVGKYTLDITVHDDSGEYPDFPFTLTIYKKAHIPVPEVLAGYAHLPYSRMQTLDAIKITDGWQWTDTAICPKNYNSSPRLIRIRKQPRIRGLL